MLSKFDKSSSMSSISFLIQEYAGLLTLFFLGMLLVIAGVLGAIYFGGYGTMDAFYLIISTITTIGVTTIPADSTTQVYIMYAVFALISVIIWGGFVLGVSELLLCEDEASEVEVVSREPAHREEFELLKKAGMQLGSASANGAMPRSIDRNEFFVMMVARLGLLEFDGIQAIYQEFDRLDQDKSGMVALSALASTRASTNAGNRFGSSVGVHQYQQNRSPSDGPEDAESSHLLGNREISHEIK